VTKDRKIAAAATVGGSRVLWLPPGAAASLPDQEACVPRDEHERGQDADDAASVSP